MKDTVLIVTRLTKHKTTGNDNRNIARILVLNDVSFSVERGECFLIIGGAEAGKTSLMNAIDPGNSTEYRDDAVRYADGIIAKTATDTGNLALNFPTLDACCVVLKDGFQMETNDHWEMLRRVRDEGGTLIASTEIHRLEKWRPMFDRILLLVEGEVRMADETNAVRAKIASDAQYLRGIEGPDVDMLRWWARGD